MIKRLFREYFLLWFMMVGRAKGESISLLDKVVLGGFIALTVVGIKFLPEELLKVNMVGTILLYSLVLFQMLSVILIPFLFVVKTKK